MVGFPLSVGLTRRFRYSLSASVRTGIKGSRTEALPPEMLGYNSVEYRQYKRTKDTSHKQTPDKIRVTTHLMFLYFR